MRRTVPILALIVFPALAGPAAAQTNASSGIGVGASLQVERVPSTVQGRRSIETRTWAATFLCGEIAPSGSAEQGTPLAPGSYRTAINVFNGQWVHPARFFVEVNVARAPGEPHFRVERDQVIVESRHAFAFDCNYIRGTDTPSGFIEGFVVLTIFASDPGDSENNQVSAAHSFKNVEGIVPPPPNQSP